MLPCPPLSLDRYSRDKALGRSTHPRQTIPSASAATATRKAAAADSRPTLCAPSPSKICVYGWHWSRSWWVTLFGGARRSSTGVRRHGRRAARAGLRVGSGYWFLRRRVVRPGPTSGLEAEGSGPGGAGGMEKLPADTRASSSRFSWSALPPVISDGGCAANPWWCVEGCACRCAGGSADVVAPGAIPGAIPGAAPSG